ncbi:lipid A export permease/ATP-binding protein MsbA [Thiohalorhabdus methylotrophus]|uniref:Lipid A export permease/ATP-binding protein MsbA n=1 Tax=Thiohalorhabdus methylotrophus TaxID=3242694 RepID=A0ABV4TW57_9GAMM
MSTGSEAPTQSTTDIYRRLLTYVWPFWGRLTVALVAMVLVAATTAGVAYLLKPVIDQIFINKNEALLVVLPLGVIVLYLMKGVANYLETYLLSWVGQRAMRQLRDDLFGRLLHMPLGFFSEHAAGTLISRLTYDVDQVEKSVTRGLSTILKDSLTAVFLLAVVFFHDWQLALVSLIGLPIVIWPLAELTRKLRKSSRSSQQARATMTRVIEEGVVGNRVIKAFNGEDYEHARFHKESEVHRKQNMRKAQATALSLPVMEITAAICIALVIYYGGYRVISSGGETSPGTFFSFLAALLMMYDPLKRLTKINPVIQQGVAAGERIFQMLDLRPEQDGGGRSLETVRGALTLDGVWFGYDPDTPVLQGIDLEVPAGNVVALVGLSGAGKSTLVNLVPRFYRPDQGRILLDGEDTADLNLRFLRDQVAIVSQEVILFNDTLAANIAYGKPEATRAEVEDAANAAGVMEYVDRLEYGLDHIVGEGGARLSGGQRQRLAIARALLRDAPILILDEATSSLDPQSEKLVQRGFERLMQGRTTLVIAHRLATIQRADSIAVMESGRIVEQGGHDELLARGGIYAYLWETQFASAEEQALGAE